MSKRCQSSAALSILKKTTRQIGLNQRQTLSIGFVASTLYGGLPLLVRKHDPDLDIQWVELTSMQQFQALESGRIDAGFGRHAQQRLVG